MLLRDLLLGAGHTWSAFNSNLSSIQDLRLVQLNPIISEVVPIAKDILPVQMWVCGSFQHKLRMTLTTNSNLGRRRCCY
jgi:hypothetical protein